MPHAPFRRMLCLCLLSFLSACALGPEEDEEESRAPHRNSYAVAAFKTP
jgi:hypothetical protein